MIEGVVRWFFISIGVGLGYLIIRYVVSILNQAKKGDLYDQEIIEKGIREHNDSLTDDELLKQANDGLGLTGHNKTSGDDPKG